MHARLRVSCSLTLFLAFTAAIASPLARADAEVVVTGTRLPMTSAGLAQNVTVVDQAEIQASHPASIAEVLSRVTGIYVDEAGPAGGFVSMYLRGAENSHLLILLDGVRLNDPTTTRGSTYDLSAIDVNQIERIEVLRGPASAIYGGEALAGVVHFITRRPAANGIAGTGYAAIGGDDESSYGGLLNLGNSKLQGQFNAGHTESGASGDDASVDLDTVSGALRLADNDRYTAGIFAAQIERDSTGFPDDSGGPRLAVNRELTSRTSTDRRYGGDISFGDIRDLQLQLKASEFKRRASDSKSPARPVRNSHWQKTGSVTGPAVAVLAQAGFKACSSSGVIGSPSPALLPTCLLYTSDAADDLLCEDLGGRRILQKKKLS